ncbi:MAG: DNA mismatch repair endonuclease MutL [Thermoplasmata archaeon]|nr:DNA mismatch repair endonuclease MutL [Thermoplasmata archaeon]
MSAAARSVRPIRRLDEETVSRIAAGEVVERPASVVKELLENAYDAGARQITIRLEAGGLERLEVADDGVGIPAAELPLALERHATSKLDPGAPLDAIVTLGFRGEALAAIASVSRLALLSRPPTSEAGSGIRIDGGLAGEPFTAGRAPGTTVEVRDLFYRTPARRKFLRSPAVEQLETLAVIEREYLSHPHVALRLESGDADPVTYPATSDPGDAAARIWGPEFRHAMFRANGPLPGGGHLDAWLGRPPLARSSVKALVLLVNHRWVESRPIAQAVRAAYAEYLPRGRYPVGLLHLALDPHRVDPNVHPTKRDVRFAQAGEVAEAVRRAVRGALVDQPHVAESPGRSASPWQPTPGRLPSRTIQSAPSASPPAGSTEAGTGVQRRLDPVSAFPTVAGTSRHPTIRLLACIDRLYWIGESEKGVVLVDQHAASERKVYDLLLAGSAPAQQELVEPVRIELSARQQLTLRLHGDAIRRSGFVVEPFGGGAFRVLAVPTYRGHRGTPEEFPRLLDELAEGGRPAVPDGGPERIAASIACHAAVRAGDTISAEELHRILTGLESANATAFACPHGRPIFVQISRAQLDRWFLRTGA